MKYFQSLLAVGFVLLLASAAQAKAAFKGKVQMIDTAEVIAVVEITSVEKASVEGKHWTYQQKASAKVENVLKGKLTRNVSLYGNEDFICAGCHFETGRYLVFLDRDGELLTGNNWQLSTYKITGDSDEIVEGFDDRKEALLSDVVSEIAIVLAKHEQSKSKRPTAAEQGVAPVSLLLGYGAYFSGRAENELKGKTKQRVGSNSTALTIC